MYIPMKSFGTVPPKHQETALSGLHGLGVCQVFELIEPCVWEALWGRGVSSGRQIAWTTLLAS